MRANRLVSCVLPASVATHSCVTEHFAAGTTHSAHVPYPLGRRSTHAHTHTHTITYHRAGFCLFFVRLSIDFDYYHPLFTVHRFFVSPTCTRRSVCITEAVASFDLFARLLKYLSHLVFGRLFALSDIGLLGPFGSSV